MAIGVGGVGVGFATLGPAAASGDWHSGHGHGGQGNGGQGGNASWHADAGNPHGGPPGQTGGSNQGNQNGNSQGGNSQGGGAPGWLTAPGQTHSQGWHGHAHHWGNTGANPHPNTPATPPKITLPAQQPGVPGGGGSHGNQPQGPAHHGGGSSGPQSPSVQNQGGGSQGNGSHLGGGSDQGGGNGHSQQGGCAGSCTQSPQSQLPTQTPGTVIVTPSSTGNTIQSSLPSSSSGSLGSGGTGNGSGNGGAGNGRGSHNLTGSGNSTQNLIPSASVPITSHTTAPAVTTPPLGPGVVLTPAAGGATGAGTTGTSPALRASTAAAIAAAAKVGPRTTSTVARHPIHRVVPNPSGGPSVIQRIERVVPGYVWAALAGAILMAAIGGGALLLAGRRVRRHAGQFAAVSAAAMTDPLTGVLNRRGFLEALDRELARARRYGLMFTLAYVDVRGLKGVNDTEGHLAGDDLLKNAAGLLKESARADDVVGRIGGDEMGLLLVEQGAEGADTVIRRITTQIPERRAALGLSSPWDLTVGTSSFPQDGSTANELLATADRRLYEQRGIALR